MDYHKLLEELQTHFIERTPWLENNLESEEAKDSLPILEFLMSISHFKKTNCLTPFQYDTLVQLHSKIFRNTVKPSDEILSKIRRRAKTDKRVKPLIPIMQNFDFLRRQDQEFINDMWPLLLDGEYLTDLQQKYLMGLSANCQRSLNQDR